MLKVYLLWQSSKLLLPPVNISWCPSATGNARSNPTISALKSQLSSSTQRAAFLSATFGAILKIGISPITDVMTLGIALSLNIAGVAYCLLLSENLNR
jgi:hypothetical protein